MGIAHGAFCVGCCWSLMLVMFGVGLASLSAMLVLGGLTAIEKNLPSGRRLTRPLGVAPDPGRGLRDRRVTGASYPRRVDGTAADAVDARRAPRPGDRGHPRAGSSPRRAPACCADGYANLSTRRVADSAGVPLSQIHYHFGSKLPAHPGGAGGRERAPARTAARDVRRARSRSGSAGSSPATSSTATSRRATSGSSRR